MTPTPAVEPLRAHGPHGEPADEELMRQASGAEATAEQIEGWLGILVARHAPPVWRYFARRGADAAEADDLTQEVFLRVLRERGRFDPAQRFAPWLFTLARNLWVSQGRRRGAERRALSGYRPPDRQAETPEGAERGEELARLWSALAALPEDDRETLRLARFEGLSFAEVGAALGCTPGAAKVRACRALAKLRAALEG